MQCTTCGCSNRTSAKFCNECGAPLVSNAKLSRQAPAVSPGMIIGEALGIQHRPEFVGRLQVCAFRIERLDSLGNRLPPVPVEMRGWLFVGVLNEADRVEIKASWQPGQTLRVGRLRNLTTGGHVIARPLYEPLLLIIAAFILFIGMIGNFEAQARQRMGELQNKHQQAVATMGVDWATTQRNWQRDVIAMKTAAARDQQYIQQQINAARGVSASSRDKYRAALCSSGRSFYLGDDRCGNSTPNPTPTHDAP